MENIWYSQRDVIQKKETLANSYDDFVEYIENSRQRQEAIRRNKLISKDLHFCNELIKEFENIKKYFSSKNIILNDKNLFYRKGNFKICYRGKSYYRKFILK